MTAFFPAFTITDTVATTLTKIGQAQAWGLEAHHTTHIEGTRLTLAQVQRILAEDHSI